MHLLNGGANDNLTEGIGAASCIHDIQYHGSMLNTSVIRMRVPGETKPSQNTEVILASVLEAQAGVGVWWGGVSEDSAAMLLTLSSLLRPFMCSSDCPHLLPRFPKT